MSKKLWNLQKKYPKLFFSSSLGSNIDSLDIPGFQRLIFKSRSLNN